MTDFDDGFVPEDEDEKDFEPDISTVAFLDQQQAEFEGMADEFEQTYGFRHDCHCGEDYAAGKVGEITQCYHGMMQEALATCARLTVELNEVTGIAQALYTELAERVAAETGSGEVFPESADDAPTGLHLVKSESESDASGSDDDSAAADASGEGFGSTPIPARNPDAPYTDEGGGPEDRKLV